MFDAQDLLTLAGATMITSAVYFVLHQLKPTVPRTWAVLVIAQIVVWVGGISTTHITLLGAVMLSLNALVVAASSLGGIHGLIDRGQQPTDTGKST